LLLLVVAACGLPASGGGEPAPSTWVGTVSDSDAVVALVQEDGAVRAHVCGGPATHATRSRWFDGGVDDSGARFAHDRTLVQGSGSR